MASRRKPEKSFIPMMLKGFFRIFFAFAALVLAAFVFLLIFNSFAAPVSTLMAGRYISGEPVRRVYIPLSKISPHLSRAVIASEDALFCTHHGVDWGALRQVIEESEEDGPSRGASTLTMQLSKNLFLWPDRSYLRKGLEIPLALIVDAVWSKEHILESYLNMAEWGEGIFGAEQAARVYFHKSASLLSPREAALLASALPSPLKRNPASPTTSQRRHASRIIHRMTGNAQYASCLKEVM